MDRQAAFNALKTYARTLEPSPGAVLPAWLNTPAEAVAAHMIRGRCCWEFALESPQDGVTGYVLDVVGNVAYEVHDGHVARALWLVGREPAPGLAVPWRERNHR